MASVKKNALGRIGRFIHVTKNIQKI